MSKKGFEDKVLEELSKLNGRFDGLEWRFDGLEWKVDSLEKEMHKWFDRLENLINDQTTELSERIDNQGQYINQAFQVISRLQVENMQKKQWV